MGVHWDIARKTEKQMERKREKEMETGAYVGVLQVTLRFRGNEGM